MRSYKTIIIAAALAVLPLQDAVCSLPNIELAGQVLFMMNQSKKVLLAQDAAQALMAEGHMFVGHEVQATNSFQREFVEYLSSCKNALTSAAELYGIYREVSMISKSVLDINKILAQAPANAIAVSLTPSRSRIYQDIITTSTMIGKDIYDVCLSKEKRTEQDRNKTMDDIRIKLRKMNVMLKQLAVYLRYTTLEDVLNNILDRARSCDKNTKRDIADRCFTRWHRVTHRVI